LRLLQDPVPLSQFDAWSKCKVPGVKANLTAVKLTAEQKAGAITNGLPVEVPVPAPAPAPVEAPVVEAPAAAAPSPSQAQQPEEVAAPAPAPVGGAATLSTAVAAGAALLGALLLAL
jgi:outer membrane biosynthesis protein TonB